MKPNYRCCISCGKVAPKTSFWRVVRINHSKDVSPPRPAMVRVNTSPNRRLPYEPQDPSKGGACLVQEIRLDSGMGRSAYICPQSDCLQIATSKKRLGRALKVRVPQHIYQNLQARLAKKC